MSSSSTTNFNNVLSRSAKEAQESKQTLGHFSRNDLKGKEGTVFALTKDIICLLFSMEDHKKQKKNKTPNIYKIYKLIG